LIGESFRTFGADEFSIRTPDALQVGAALSMNCKGFLTNDKRLKSVNKLMEIVMLEDCL
jgi:predicted nucleic acid-binding protein